MARIPERAVRALAAEGFIPAAQQPFIRLRESGDWRLEFAQRLPDSAPQLPRTPGEMAPGDGKPCLTFGFGTLLRCSNWLGDRLVWWPQGLPRGRLVGVISSRLPRKLEMLPDWFSALRAVCRELDPHQDALLCATATATARFLRRAAVHFQLPALVLYPPETRSTSAWLRGLPSGVQGTTGDRVTEAFVSPLLCGGRPPARCGGRVPLRDQLAVALAHRLFVLKLRPGGHCEQLVRWRLEDPRNVWGSVQIASGQELVSPAAAGELAKIGATVWQPKARDASPQSFRSAASRSSLPSVEEAVRSCVVAVPSAESWNYLTHCTRRPQGAWPDETEEAFIDQLILDPGNVDRSPLAALLRMITQQRIIASYRPRGSPDAAVCFTEVPLGELRALRVFRPHRGRWDFEPYGIAIRRSWLEQRGARRVRYGDQQLWSTLSAQEKPFFQRQASGGSGGKRIEWAVEREWRHLGHVDLSQLPAAEGLVFVPSQHEAGHLASASRWPIAVLAGG